MKKKRFLKVEDLKLLPETHDFFDIQTSRAINVFLYVTLILLVSLVVWAFFAQMDDVVKATAILRPIENISELKCLTTGEVQQKNYYQNQRVSKGDLLLAVDCRTEENELETLEAQRQYYEKELVEYKKFYNIVEFDIEDASDLSVQAESYILEYKKYLLQIAELKNKYSTEFNMPQSLRIQQKIDECETQLNQAELNFSSWKKNKLFSLGETIKNYEEKIQSIDLRIISLQRSIKNSKIFSPIDGIIDEKITLNIGDYIIGGADVARIIPLENEQLKAEIVLDAAKIARVRNEQEVKLRFSGLPPSSFGQLKGFIDLIPADLSLSNNLPVFIVEAKIPEPYLYSSNGDKVILRSGLTAEARIIISRDSVLKMVLRKLDFLN